MSNVIRRTPQVPVSAVRDLASIPLHHPTQPSAAAVLGIGRATAFAMADRGEIPSFRCGSRRLVAVADLLAMKQVAGLTTDQAEPAGQGATSHSSTLAPLTGESR